MKPITTTQINFCRLAEITEEQYQTFLFETGYRYTEWYWFENLPHNWQMLSKVMRETKEYWFWWATQWNIRTQEAFGVVGINENEKQISTDESDALLEAFLDSHKLKSFEWIYPNKLVFMAFNQKLYENRRINNNQALDRNRRKTRSTYTTIK